MPYLLMLVNTVNWTSINQSINAKLLLLIILIGIVAYAFVETAVFEHDVVDDNT